MQWDMEELRRKSLEMEFKLKSPQKQLEQEKQKFEKEKVARTKLLHECEVLHRRLRECGMNLLNETADKLVLDSSSVQDALELLNISDDRIEVLLAEAQILAQDDYHDVSTAGDMSSTEGGRNSADNELRTMLSEILVDNITLRKQVSFVPCYALKMGILAGKDDVEVPSENSAENKPLDTR